MSGYWDARFAGEGRIWGDTPSVTVKRAEEVFRAAGVRSVLVPGAGYGRNAEFFADAGCSVTGVEISGEALGLVQKGSAVTYVRGSFLDFDAAGREFDAIYGYNVLHLFRRDARRAFLEKCLGVLKPGGVAFFAVFSDEESQFGKGREVEENTFESKPGRPVHFFTDQDLRSSFAGFLIVETGAAEDPEDHGSEGPHAHALRYIVARKKGYDFDGGGYSKASGHQKEWGRGIIAELELSGEERVLDLGCGDGALSAEIAERVPRGSVLGIDSSPSMIASARGIECGNLSFELMDIDALDYNACFDLIFSNATLHWVKDHRRLLSNCSRALAGKGRLRFNFAGDGNCARFISVVRRAMESPRFQGYFRGFEWPWLMPSAAEYEKLAADAGRFDSLLVWEENADRYFSREELIRWIDQPSIVPFLAPLSGGDREDFREEVREKTLAATAVADGRHFETFRRINVSARL